MNYKPVFRSELPGVLNAVLAVLLFAVNIHCYK